MIKKIAHLFLFVICTFLYLTISPLTAEAFTGSGSGTSGDPYQITTCNQLQEMQTNLSAYYRQNNDIDCTGVSFTPIGIASPYFTGTFDGYNYAITHITITSTGDAGLFGGTHNATISNVRLVSGTVSSSGNSADVGTLIGSEYGGSTVTHCGSSLTLSPTGSQYVGGLVSWTYESMTIRKSYFDGVIGADSSAAVYGGLVGAMEGGANVISDSYSAGTMTMNQSAYQGGLVALIYTGITVTTSYTANTVTLGGSGTRAGFIDGFNAGSVSNSFSATTFSGSGGTVRGMFNSSAATSTNDYFDSYLANTATSGCSAGCTAVNSANSTPNYFKGNTTNAPLTTNWDFTNTWQVNTGGYPTLRGFTSPVSPTSAPQNNSSSSTILAPRCTDAPPTNAPNLFQVSANGNNATMYFVPVSGPNNKYFVSYGLTSTAEGYGTSFDYKDTSGAIPYTVNALFPGTWYFKVRGHHGCMPGSWSNVMTVKVASFFSLGTTSTKNIVKNNVLGVATSGACSNYTVQQGDSLWTIAMQKLGNGTKYQSIMQENNLPTTLIQSGQTLKVGC